MSDVNSDIFIDTDGTIYEKRTQEVGHILDANKASYNASPETGRHKGDLSHVASIPLSVVMQWKKEGFDLFDKNVSQKELARRLNDPQYRYLRTMPGRV